MRRVAGSENGCSAPEFAPLMNLRTALKEGMERLGEAGVSSHALAAELLLMHVLERDRAFLHSHPEATLTPAQVRAYFELVRERATGKPTQYLTGHQEFWGLDFHVAPGVFIPRPETEHLVEAVLELTPRMAPAPRYNREGLPIVPRPLRIVDVGTGCGSIAIALARELENAEIFAVDIAPEALAMARHNARRLAAAERVFFLESDLLGAFLAEAESSPFDIVVSNPPYVNPDETAALPVEVREYEPAQALFAAGAGLEFYRRLIEQAEMVLRPGGWMVVELGFGLSEAVVSLLTGSAGGRSPWAEHELRNDLAGIPRVLLARKRLE